MGAIYIHTPPQPGSTGGGGPLRYNIAGDCGFPARRDVITYPSPGTHSDAPSHAARHRAWARQDGAGWQAMGKGMLCAMHDATGLDGRG